MLLIVQIKHIFTIKWSPSYILYILPVPSFWSQFYRKSLLLLQKEILITLRSPLGKNNYKTKHSPIALVSAFFNSVSARPNSRLWWVSLAHRQLLKHDPYSRQHHHREAEGGRVVTALWGVSKTWWYYNDGSEKVIGFEKTRLSMRE